MKNHEMNNNTKMNKQIPLKNLVVRPIRKQEENRWNQLMSDHHYLGFRTLVGETLKYVATLHDRWVALLGWGAAAFQCGPRDQWIDWTKEQRGKRLKYVANNQRFLILPDTQIKNLASKTLALNLKRLSLDWQTIFGHPILLAETFVDHHRFTGTSYRAAGWMTLGQTQGYGRNGGRYFYHGQTKTMMVHPTHPDSKQLLSAPYCAPQGGQVPMMDINKANIEHSNGLIGHLRQLSDPRKRRGIRHKQTPILAIAICAVLSAARSYVAIAEWADELTQDQLRKFGCRYHLEKATYIAPSEPTIRRTIQSVDSEEVDQAITKWLQHEFESDAIAFDGKTLRGSGNAEGKAVHLLSAFVHKEGVVIAQQDVDHKTNEITAVKPLLDPLDIEGKVVTGDALHTQTDTATYLKEEKKSDYVFTVKDNQKTLRNDIADLDDEDFSPSAHREK